ncbi:methyl-accepting chemotaxis protein [Pseudomonas kuykendallii]|uniref:Methyl-accepting chemotaxis protein-1, serine sensor receptor n=1 Tax=Pseudomonas kuykendallii TaxID=1007099 RepID=A0A1H3E0B2_9PSED|nr:methyl-accepting chemotaxis protein [Pseudomonas kuykendallii]MCQ4270071.1 methyl-accepting chemotaxis protein [Pseudomonas kuykendallii]SDX72132.1 methyl-accepting chemotaxis protein-1, serine sensor receptor [Pseudomonas kuykendallii]
MNLTVKAKLGLSFASVTATALLVSLISLYALNAANDRLSDIVHGANERSQLAGKARLATTLRAIAARNLVLVSENDDRQHERAAVLAAHQDVQTTMGQLKQKIAASPDVTSEEKDLVARIDSVEAQYGPVALKIVDLAWKGEREKAISMMNTDCMPLLSQLIAATGDYMAYSERQAERDLSDAQNAYFNQRNLLLLVCVAAIILASVLGLTITRGLFTSLGAEPSLLSDEARRVAEGDLRAAATSQPAGSVMASLGEMQSKLNVLIGSVRGSANVISSAAEELSSSAEQTRAGVAAQKSEVDQVAAAMHQMTATVQEVARHCEQAAAAAQHATDEATAGNGMASRAVSQIERLSGEVNRSAEAMGRLQQESTNIGGVLDVIKSVADQTNLLALNAAIEAARAGEAGRGFAVVADEVRSLARRTQDATQEIETLIAGLQKIAQEVSTIMLNCKATSDATVKDVGDTGNAVLSITRMISDIQQMNLQIATAADQQSQVAEQISRNVHNVSSIADQSASATDETAASSIQLARLGSDLQSQVARFRL